MGQSTEKSIKRSHFHENWDEKVPFLWKLGQKGPIIMKIETKRSHFRENWDKKRIMQCAKPCSMRYALCNVLCNALQHAAKIWNKFSFLWKVRKKVLILVKNENFFLIFVKNEKKSSHFREKCELFFSFLLKMRKKVLIFVKNEKKVLIFHENENFFSHF